MGSTAVVLVIVLLSGVFLGMVDAILSRLVRMLVG
ncbi:MAG: preprotein translocase subunit SecE [Acidobacteriota bacterium]